MFIAIYYYNLNLYLNYNLSIKKSKCKNIFCKNIGFSLKQLFKKKNGKALFKLFNLRREKRKLK